MTSLAKVQIFTDAEGQLYEKVAPAEALKYDDVEKCAVKGKPGFYVKIANVDDLVDNARDWLNAVDDDSDD